jgi:hypothetical protein
MFELLKKKLRKIAEKVVGKQEEIERERGKNSTKTRKCD